MGDSFNPLRKLFAGYKGLVVFCGKCGQVNDAENYRCKACEAWLRPLLSIFAAYLVWTFALLLWVVFQTKVVPTVTDIHAGLGLKLHPLLQRTIDLSHLFNNLPIPYYFLVYIAFIYLGFIWRPHRRTGLHLIWIFVNLFLLVTSLVYLITLINLAIDIPNYLHQHLQK